MTKSFSAYADQLNLDAFSSSDIANGPGHHGYINIPGTDERRIVYHRRKIGDLERGHRMLCIDDPIFDGDEMLPVIMT